MCKTTGVPGAVPVLPQIVISAKYFIFAKKKHKKVGVINEESRINKNRQFGLFSFVQF